MPLSKTSLIIYRRSTPICRLIRTTRSRKSSRLGAEWPPKMLQHPSWIDRDLGFRPPLGRSPMTISREILLVLQPAQARRSNQGWILMADHDHRRKAGVAAEPELKRAMGGQQNGRVDNVGRRRRSISATFGHLPTRENPEMVIAAGFDFSDLIVPRSCRHHRARGARCSVPRRRRAVTGRYRKSARWHRSSRHAPQTGAGSSRL